MPIGVPKVPYRMPGDDSAWVDLYNRLYRERILFLCQNLDDACKQLIGYALLK
jgi:ATP-dependent Clp protease protease subunit